MISEQGMREILVELQQTWLKQYKLDREKLLVDLTEKVEQYFLIFNGYFSSCTRNTCPTCREQKWSAWPSTGRRWKQNGFYTLIKIYANLFRLRQEQNYELQLQEEVQRLSEKHRREVQMIKKKQWCWQCELRTGGDLPLLLVLLQLVAQNKNSKN